MRRKLLKTLLIIFLTVIAFAIFAIFVLGMNPFKQSGYANCVVAESEVAFIGDRLKFIGNAKRSTVKLEACINLDKELDQASGPDKGRVRWAECAVGPDCDETGMN